MAFASTLVSNLTAGSSSPVALSGAVQLAIYGDFSTAATTPNILARGSVVIEMSPSANVWIPIPETDTSSPTTLTLSLGTGADVRATVVNGPVAGVTIKYASVP